jgi:hypothetical protein
MTAAFWLRFADFPGDGKGLALKLFELVKKWGQAPAKQRNFLGLAWDGPEPVPIFSQARRRSAGTDLPEAANSCKGLLP